MIKQFIEKIRSYSKEGLFHIFGSKMVAQVGGLISSVIVIRHLEKVDYGFAIWFLFSVVFAIKHGVDKFECTEEGYKAYLEYYPYNIKTQLDPNHEAAHHENFITNCKFMKAKNDYTAYDMDFSYLFDLSADKITELMDIAPHFTGAGSWCEEVAPIQPHWDNGRLHERKFEKEEFNEVSDIDTCSTSWATQAIKIAENVVKKEANMDVKFSVKYLMKCLGPKMSLPEDPCRGYNSKDIFSFIAMEGLITEEYAKELDEADLCEPDNLKTFYFEVLEIDCPNKGNLMNFIANGHHVHVMLALNLEKMRYVNEIDSESDAPFTGGTMQPTVWATVSGYQDSNEKGEDGYWKLETNVSPFETIYFKLPLRNNTNNANYAGIAGYAYGLALVSAPTPEPTTEPPTTLPPTTLPPTTEPPTTLPPTTLPPTTLPPTTLPPTTLPPTTLPPTTLPPTTLPPTTLPPTTPAPTTLPPTTLPPPEVYTIDNASGCFDYWTEIISDPKHDQMVGTLIIKECDEVFQNIDLKATYPGTDGKPTSPFARMTTLIIGDGSSTLKGLNSLSITGLELLTTIDIKGKVVYRSGNPKTCTAGTFLKIEDNPALTSLKIGAESMRAWCDFTVQNNAALTYIGVGGVIDDETGNWTTVGMTGDCFYRADKVTIVGNPELEKLHVADRVFKSFQTFTFKNASDMLEFTVEEDSMQGRSTEDGDDNIPDGEVYLEDLGNFAWEGFGTSFTLVKKIEASNIAIEQSKITLTAAFQNANYDDVDQATAGGLWQYIFEQQHKPTPAP